jgi:hypothetical protein
MIIGRNSRCMQNLMGSGVGSRQYRHTLPMSVSHRQDLASQVGIRGGSNTLLLDKSISLAERRKIDGTGLGAGFGVKSPSLGLLKKLDNLNVGKKRKNISMDF